VGALLSLLAGWEVVVFVFDLPFAPLFLGVMFLIHPIIGALGLAGGIILLSIAIFAEVSARRTNETAASVNSEAFNLASGLSRQRSAIVAMGLTHNALAKWRETKETARDLNLKAGAKETGFSSMTKAGRQMLQILILGAGGALAITQQISPGAIVAGSIILGRALGPIDQIVGSWRGISGARSAWNQIQTAIENDEVKPEYTPLPNSSVWFRSFKRTDGGHCRFKWMWKNNTFANNRRGVDAAFRLSYSGWPRATCMGQ